MCLSDQIVFGFFKEIGSGRPGERWGFGAEQCFLQLSLQPIFALIGSLYLPLVQCWVLIFVAGITVELGCVFIVGLSTLLRRRNSV